MVTVGDPCRNDRAIGVMFKYALGFRILMVNDILLFVIMSVAGGWILMFSMISSKQKLQLHSFLRVAFGEEDTIVKNTANVLVDGWHIETRYTLTVSTAPVGGDISVSMLTTSKPLSAVVADNALGIMAMPKEADAGGTGGQISSMAPIMPSTIFVDPAMVANTSFIVKKRHWVEVEKTERMDFMVNFGSQNATISAGEITCAAIAIILIGAYYGKDKTNGGGIDVQIQFVDIGNALKFGAWRPFCSGRMGNIRVQYYSETNNTEETLFFGPDVGIDIPHAEEDGEIVIMPSGDLITVSTTVMDEETAYNYVTNYVRGPWFLQRDQNVVWAMDNSESTPSRVCIDFVFIPNYNAPFSIPFTYTDLEIGTADFEEHFVMPFDMYITNINTDAGIIGTVVGLVVLEIHLVKSESNVIPTFVGSEQVLGGNLLGVRNNLARVQSSTKKDALFLKVFPGETASGVFTGVDDEKSRVSVKDYYKQGSGIVVFAQAIDATTVSFLQADVQVTGFSRVKSDNFGANFLESDALVIFEEASA